MYYSMGMAALKEPLHEPCKSKTRAEQAAKHCSVGSFGCFFPASAMRPFF